MSDAAGGMDLSDQEADALALFLAARHLRSDDWLEWEDVPNLGEYAFDRLVDASRVLADSTTERSRLADRQSDIDSAHLFEQAIAHHQRPVTP